MKRIVRSVVFTICQGVVLKEDEKAVAEFLGAPEHEKEFSRLGHETSGDEVLRFLRSITHESQLIQFYKGPSGYGGECKECVLAQVECVY